ncbi:unnamed protein product [Alopecurus aequalis]
MAAESWWCWPLPGWLSSGTACFLFFNALVGVVVVLSWGRGGDATLSTRRKRLTRSASSMVMERLWSMSTIFSFRYPAVDDDYDSIAPPASQLQHVQEYYYASLEESETRQAVSEVEPEPSVPLVESLAAPRMPSAPVAVAGAEVCAAASTLGRKRDEAETRIPGAAAAAKGAATSRKWKVAERRAYAEMDEKAEVNARAERFIRQFREDRKLERLNSIFGSGRSVPAR